MAEYVGMDVRVSHLPGTPEQVRDEVERVLRAAFSDRLPYGDGDIEVELVESAG